MERYKRIQIEEREEIMKSIAGGKSLREIAIKLNRNVSSISREIKRNKKGRKGNKDLRQAQYSANKAQEKAKNRQKGTIENTNGLIRVIFPKQTNFDSITNEQIQ